MEKLQVPQGTASLPIAELGTRIQWYLKRLSRYNFMFSHFFTILKKRHALQN